MKPAARIASLASLLSVSISVPTPAQVPAGTPEFEITSVKPCRAEADATRGRRKGDGRQPSPDRLHLPCQTLLSLIQWAYVNFADGRFNPLASIPISGGPAWINSESFEIDAKAESPQSWGTMNGPMLRSLLQQRFHLKIRRDMKEAAVYAIAVAKGGPRLQISKGDCVIIDQEHPPAPIDPHKPLPTVCGLARLNSKGWEAFAVTMDEFAALLSTYADRRVVNRTGLSGTFDIRLDVNADDLGIANRSGDSAQAAGRPDQQDTFARIRTAVGKLGLRIESAKGQDESLVIEAVQRPSEN